MFRLHPDLKSAWDRERPGLFMANAKIGLAHLPIPKNASTSMRRLLDPFKWYRDCHPTGRKTLEPCVRFAVVRDPFRRFVSSFNEVDERLGRKGYAHKLIRTQPFAKVKCVRKRFRQFADDLLGGIFDNHLVQQARHVRAAKLSITEWLVHEKLKTDFPAFIKRHGLKKSAPHVKKSIRSAKADSDLLRMLKSDRRMTEIVRHVYAEDFKLYEEIINARVG